jgi:hypothetical protein
MKSNTAINIAMVPSLINEGSGNKELHPGM